MNARPRLRASLGWCGLSASLAFALAWGLSHWWGIRYADRACNSVGIGGGVAWVYLAPPGSPWQVVPAGFSVKSRPGERFYWGFRFDLSPPTCYVWIPIWAFTLGAGLLGAVGWRWERSARNRARVGCCRECGYDCRGLPGGATCPECGAANPVAEPRSR